jgi:hypothetical protein
MMIKNKWIYIILITLLCSACIQNNKSKAENKEGKTMKRLEAYIVKIPKEINGLAGLNIKNTLATINDKGEFAFIRIADNGTVDIDPIVPGFPGDFGAKFYSDSENNVLWMIRGRGFYCLDIETKKTGHCTASIDGNAKILTNFLADPVKKIFYIEIAPPYPLRSYYVLYDLLKNNIDFRSRRFDGIMYPFYDNTFLFCEFIEEKDIELLKWQIVDHKYSQETKSKENKLVKELTKMMIDINPDTKTIHLGKRMMIGTAEPLDTLTYFSIRWDEKFENIKIEPIIIQKPERSILSTGFIFSPDGNWLKTQADIKSGNFLEAPELLVYNVNEIYPQGLSLPIYCGYTKKDAAGAFMMHDTWGPCYVEQDPDVTDSLFVFKLNDGLKILAEEARNRF